MRTRYALLLSLVPSLALAQTATVSFTETVSGSGGLADQVINLAECRNAVGGATSKLTLSWTTTPTGTQSFTVEVWDQACNSTGTPNKHRLGTVTPTAGVGGTLDVANVATDMLRASPLNVDCTRSTSVFVCVTALDSSNNSLSPVLSGELRVDVALPNTPVITGIDAGDGALTPHWSQPSGGAADATSYTATATPTAGGAAPGTCTVTGGGSTSCRIGGLANGTTYDVTVVALSATLNTSADSDAVQGTPVPIDDFWRYYKKNGGREEGGCGSGGAGLLGLLLLAPLVPRLRRRTGLRAAAGLLLLLAATPAFAAPSERWGSFQFQMGGYRPSIDSEFNGPVKPYQAVFGGGRGLTFQVQVSRALFSQWGSLELGVGVGWFSKSGHGFEQNTGLPAAEKTQLRILPLSLNLAYRFDYFVDRAGFPLVPYARASLERWQWWVTNGAGNTATVPGGPTGSGATNGWSAGLGLSFLLDFLDPTLAREMDRDTGINHVYLFAEAYRSRVNDFGSRKSWNLSDDAKVSWSFGLHFSF